MVTENELIDKITAYMQNNATLCPLVFDEHNLIYDYVRQGLLNIADFFIEQTQKAFASLKVEDIVLAGGIVSYIYNDQTDIDLGIVAVPDVANADADLIQRLFRYVNRSFPQKGYKFHLFARNIDYGLVEPSHFFHGSGTYSLSENRWRQMPVHREFTYSPQELFEYYKDYCDKVYAFVDSLPKIEDKWLTFESCRRLEAHLDALKKDALLLKENGPEQEYGMEYNCHRIFNKLGVYGHFKSIITEAHYQLVNVLELRDE